MATMKKLMFLPLILAVALIAVNVLTTPAHALSPSIEYTSEQHEVCSPKAIADSDSVEDKANTSGKTVWARSVISAPDGFMFDPRPEAVAYSVDVHHMSNNGEPEVTKRINGFAPVQYEIKSKDHRGKSLRLGRTVRASNQIVAMAVRNTLECVSSLGLF